MENAPPDVDQIYAAVHLEVTPAERTVPGRGGSASYTITAQQHTRWSAIWDWTQYWLDPEAPPFGIGDGTVSFATRNPNPDPTPRSQTIRVNYAQQVTFTQEAGVSLSSIAPTAGPMDGGPQVTFYGTGFEPEMTPRNLRRWRERYERWGYNGLVDQRRCPSTRRVPLAQLERVLQLYRERYAGFNGRHFEAVVRRELSRHGWSARLKALNPFG